MKKRDNRGLSDIVTTLIIVLLALVAIGIIWVVINNVVQQGSESVEVSAKCIAVDLDALSVTENPAGTYAVTLKRNAGGEEIAGVKITLFNTVTNVNTGVIEFGDAIGELETSTKTIVTAAPTLVADADKLEYTAYFTDASGNEQLCSQTGSFPF